MKATVRRKETTSMSSSWSLCPSSVLLLLLVTGTATPTASTACGGREQPLCRCTVDRGVPTVDCSGLDLLAVPDGIPDDTEILNLSENSIEVIRRGDFANLGNLRELYMVQNVIRSDQLHDNAFQNLRKLEWLDLNDNRISMSQGSETPFLPLLNLRHLDLGDNNIATIDPVFLPIFDRLDSLFMVSNPLICDCNLLWFRNWLLNKSTQTFLASGVQCFTPSSVSLQPVETALFCIPVQRCYFCNQASSNAACNLAQQQCSGTNPACQNEVRWNGGSFRISKECQSLDACLNNARNNENECNSNTANSVCRYCCQGDKCNAPRTAILAGYHFPFPDAVRPTAAQSTIPETMPTTQPIPPTTLPQLTTQPLSTTPIPSTTQPSPPTSLPPQPTTPSPPPTTSPTTPSPPPTLPLPPPITSPVATTAPPLPTTTVENTFLQEHACEGYEFSISCSRGGVIDLQSALYGRVAGFELCGISGASSRSCGDPDESLLVVSEMCGKKERCSFVVSNRVFGDPCVNTYKYLVVHYTCVGEATSSTTRTTTPAASTARQTVSTPGPTTPRFCPVEITEGEAGSFLWPATLVGDTVGVPCAYGETAGRGTRQCVSGQDSEGTGWGLPDTSECPTASSILKELSNVTIRRDNALDVSETLTDVTSVPDVLKPDDVTNAVDTFENLANALGNYDEDSPGVLGNVLDTIDKLGQVSNERLVRSQLNDDSSSRLLRTIDSFNLGVQFPSNVLEEDTPSVDVAVIDITDPRDDGLLFFGSGSPTGNSHPKVVSNSSSNAADVLARNKSVDADVIVKGSIYLPNSLLKSLGNRLTRCQFVMYEETTFFDIIQSAARNRTLSNKQEDEGAIVIPSADNEGSEVMTNSTPSSAPSADCIAVSCRPGFRTIINSAVISGAVGDQIITNLQEPVTITFRKMRLDADNPRCVFWDEAENDGWGGWSQEGCSLDASNKPEDTSLVCKCNHLTNFAMLMDIYNDDTVIPEGHQIALSVISYAGCSLSLIGLVLTLITYTCCGPRSRAKVNEKKFSGDQRAKVLVNFVVSLILVNLFFIAGSVTAEFQDAVVPELCAAMAVCLHFSLLAAMAWMAIQAFNMYMALVKVFAAYYSHFLLKMLLIGWGIPLVIVGITLGVDLKNYGYNTDLCWISGIPFYVAFLLPVCLVLVFNFVVFVAVTWKLCKLRKSKISKSDRFDLGAQMRASVSITVLLGLTWVLGIFAIGEASLTFMYLFATFNSLQGFSVFVFQCLLQPEMRKRWVAACCPYCAPETTDSKSGVYSTSRSQTNLVNQPTNWRKGTQSTTLSSSYAAVKMQSI